MSTFKVSFMFMVFNLIFYTMVRITDAFVEMNWLLDEDNFDWFLLIAMALFAIFYPVFSKIFNVLIKYLNSTVKKETSNEASKPTNR